MSGCDVLQTAVLASSSTLHGVRCGGQQYDRASKSARRAAIAAQERVAVRP